MPMDRKVVKEIEAFIVKIVNMLKEDPLKGYVYLRHELDNASAERRAQIGMIWEQRDSYTKEGDLIRKGESKFMVSIREELMKVRNESLKKKYEELFGK